MKQIKTITWRLHNTDDFDKEVNAAIEEGWTLTKRRIIIPNEQPQGNILYTMLYAELEREVFGKNDKKNCTNCKHKGTLFVPDSPCPECKSYMKWECGL